MNLGKKESYAQHDVEIRPYFCAVTHDLDDFIEVVDLSCLRDISLFSLCKSICKFKSYLCIIGFFRDLQYLDTDKPYRRDDSAKIYYSWPHCNPKDRI